MSQTMRVALVAALAVLGLTLTAVPATAGKSGPNNANAKLCQKNGWASLYTSTGGTFTSEKACTSYAANGGELADGQLSVSIGTPQFYPDGFWVVPFTIGQAGRIQPFSLVSMAPRPLADFGPWTDVDANGTVIDPGPWFIQCTYINSVQVSGTAANGTQIVSNIAQTNCPQT